MMGLRPTGTNYKRHASKQNRQQMDRDLATAASNALLERTQADELDAMDDGTYTDLEDHLWASHQAGKEEEQEDDYIIMQRPNPFGGSIDSLLPIMIGKRLYPKKQFTDRQPIPEECRAVL